MSTPTIAIIGAGLAGLTLARILRVNRIAASVYDLDTSANSQPQGGMLDIHEESGQAALRAAGLFEAFTARVHPGGDAMRVLDKHAVSHMADEGNGGRPEVNRGVLRDLLIGSLPVSTIRWGSKSTNARTRADGRHEVTLADGSTFTADLLVGADGAWSRIRPLVSPATPIYSGVSFVEVHLLDADERHADAAAVVGAGVLFALAEEKALIFHRDPDGRLHGYIALKTPADWGRTIDFTDTDAAKALLLEHFAGWDGRLQRLITGADGALTPRTIHALPVGHRWDRTPGVTLVGDAAHLMSPFAGEGANLAMQDGAELALALIAHGADIEAALAQYEAALFPRGAAAAAESVVGLAAAFTPDAPREFVALMASHDAEGA